MSPRSVPRPVSAAVLREVEFATATAGASFAAAKDGGEVTYPPPLWQGTKARNTKAVVTTQDLNSFQHFWLINEDKKLLMVAIPKVSSNT